VNDGIACDEGTELPYEMLHDGIGNNAMDLFEGWMFRSICLWTANAIPDKLTEHAGDGNSKCASS
jgi:hypothetical protein